MEAICCGSTWTHDEAKNQSSLIISTYVRRAPAHRFPMRCKESRHGLRRKELRALCRLQEMHMRLRITRFWQQKVWSESIIQKMASSDWKEMLGQKYGTHIEWSVHHLAHSPRISRISTMRRSNRSGCAARESRKGCCGQNADHFPASSKRGLPITAVRISRTHAKRSEVPSFAECPSTVSHSHYLDASSMPSRD